MRRTLAAFSLLGLLGLAPAASPEPILFFGEDWEAAGPDFPSARAARDAFVAQLDGPGEEDFEGARGRVLELPLGGYGARLTGRARDSVSTALVWTPGRHATSARRFYEHGSD